MRSKETMAYVMALQQGWPTDNLQFKGTFRRHMYSTDRLLDG